MRIAAIVAPVVAGALLIVCFGPPLLSQQASASDWPMYRHDYAGTGYSPLAQINTRNVSSLKEAWAYRLLADESSTARRSPVRAV